MQKEAEIIDYADFTGADFCNVKNIKCCQKI